MSEVCFSYVIEGQAQHVRRAIEAIEHDLSPALAAQGWVEVDGTSELVKSVGIRRRLSADAGAIASIVSLTVLAFVGAWAGNRFLTAIAGSWFDHAISGALGRFKPALPRAPLEFRVLVRFAAHDVSVVARVLVQDDRDVMDCANSIRSVISMASSSLAEDGKRANVYSYVVRSGEIPSEPSYFASFEAAITPLSTKVVTGADRVDV